MHDRYIGQLNQIDYPQSASHIRMYGFGMDRKPKFVHPHNRDLFHI